MRNFLSTLLLAISLAFLGPPAMAQPTIEAPSETTVDQKARPGAVVGPTVTPPTVVQQATPVAIAQAEPDPEPGGGGLGGFVTEHWVALVVLLLAFIEGVLRLTPSETDNSIFNLIKRIIDAILPNRRQAGGIFK